jgi:uncharacterized protein YdbL (DUF1318 family)
MRGNPTATFAQNLFVDIQRGLAMASITVEIPDAQLKKLQQLAQKNGISLEDLLCASIENWLSYLKSEFVQASS